MFGRRPIDCFDMGILVLPHFRVGPPPLRSKLFLAFANRFCRCTPVQGFQFPIRLHDIFSTAPLGLGEPRVKDNA